MGVPGANTSIDIVLLEKGLGHVIKSQNLGRTHMNTYKVEEHKLDLRTYRDVYSSAGHLCNLEIWVPSPDLGVVDLKLVIPKV